MSDACPICGAAHAVCGPVVPLDNPPVDWTPIGEPMPQKLEEWGQTFNNWVNEKENAPMFKVTQIKENHPDSPYIANERLYLTAEGKVVGEDDPNRLTLLAAQGATLTAEQVAQYGLGQGDDEKKGGDVATPLTAPQQGEQAVQPTTPPSEVEGKEAEAEENKAVKNAPDDKAVKGPAETKVVKGPQANK